MSATSIFNLSEALQRDPENPHVLFALVLANAQEYQAHGEDKYQHEFTAHSTKLMRLGPENYAQRIAQTACLDNEGKPREAEEWYRGLSRDNLSDLHFPHLHLGFCLWNQGRNDEAIECMEKALRREPTCFQAMYALARLNLGRNLNKAIDYANNLTTFTSTYQASLPHLVEPVRNLRQEVLQQPKPQLLNVSRFTL